MLASSSIHPQPVHSPDDEETLYGEGPEAILAQRTCTTPLIPSADGYAQRRTIMMHGALIDAMYYGAMFVFSPVGVLGLCMETVLRR